MSVSAIRIGQWFQGPTGRGQGGWTAQRLAQVASQPTTVRLQAPIPLETDLSVAREGESWQLLDTSQGTPEVIMQAERWQPDYVRTEPVEIDEAARARARFPVADAEHPAPFCFSCGLQHDSMCIHAGPLADGRFATDWTVPGWTRLADGSADEAAVWAALDCTASWYVYGHGGRERPGPMLTVQFAAEVLVPLMPGERYALVGWHGDWSEGWEGRKRGAASAAFDARGRLVAQSRSFWLRASI
ncbi:MAG: hypothetical protein KDK91_11435 [Gammaproteobacteria bacterium]|nr:hypothetical protein [Gammaproteobacteria bacterium]